MSLMLKTVLRPLSTETTIQAVGASTAEKYSPDAAIQALEKATRRAFDDFAEMIGTIPSVEQVSGQAAGAYLHLVTYVSCSTEAERFRVYEAEKRLFAEYPHLRFEFDLVDRRGYRLESSEIRGKYSKTIRQLPDTTHEIQ
jgi:hypothetical protein